MQPWLLNLWRSLIEPSDTVTQPAVRRQSRLLIAMNLLLLVAFVLTYLLPLVFQVYPLQAAEVLIMVVGSVAWLYAMYVTRQGHYQTGARILVISISAIIGANTYVSDGLTPDWTMYYLLIPILFSSIFLSPRFTIGFVIGNIVGMVLLTELIDDYSHADLPIIFLTVASAIIIAFDYHRTKLEADRQAILRQNEERYRILFESINDAIAVTENGYLQDVNPAFERLFGLPCPQIYGDPLQRFVPLPQREHPQHPQEVVAHTADGTPFYAEIHSQQFHQGDKVMQVSSIRDITDRKLAAKRDIDLALEREKITLMQQFINDASHDLRTPLSVIYTSLHLLKRREQFTDKGTRQMETLEQQASLLNNIVENLINLARLDKAAHNRVVFVLTDINALLTESIVEQQPYAQTEHITLEQDFAATLPQIVIDPEEIKRAIRQLLMNAIRYTPAGGTVTVTTDQQHDQVRISVADTGIGIAPEDQQHIFDLFYRADPSRRSDSGGMGIGLNICQRIVEAHNGHIHIESEIGGGTTFTIAIPLRITMPVAD